MPAFSKEFHISAADSSLSLSLTTGLLAVSMLVAGALSEMIGRKMVMTASLLSAAALTIVSSLVPSWPALLVFRAIEGIAFSGLPAVAMAYLAEEMDPASVGLAMGLYIGGSALGGMSGRFIAGVLADLGSWRIGVGAIGAFSFVAGIIFWRSLPPSRHFHRRVLSIRHSLHTYGEHLTDYGLCLLFSVGFLAMGSFVTLYNYVGYRLVAPPYFLNQTAIGAIFLVYLVGIFSSSWVGDLAGRLGRRNVLWANVVLMLAGLFVTLAHPLAWIIVGIALLTFGFFGAHSVLSSWVGMRARHSKAQASSLYLFFYYLGSSIVGTAGGFFWSSSHWLGVVLFVSSLLALALAISLILIGVKPLAHSTAAVRA